jgi:hypothetical protein
VYVVPTEVRLDTEFLSEFGMTLSELEARHGRAVSGRIESERATYFFRGSGGSYSFEILDNELTLNSQNTLTDGTARVNNVDSHGTVLSLGFITMVVYPICFRVLVHQ